MKNPFISLTSAIDGRIVLLAVGSIDAVFPDNSRDPERTADGSAIVVRGVNNYVHIVEPVGKVAQYLLQTASLTSDPERV